MTRLVACLLVIVSIASPLGAQRLVDLSVAARQAPTELRPGKGTTLGPRFRGDDTGSTSPWAIAASAVLPGAGQAILRSNRALPYLALEAFAWTAYVSHSQRYRARRDDYRNLAARAARAPFSSIAPNGNFEYYERMTHYAESGRYDLVAGGGIDPETDSVTYNGAVWLLARRTFWTNPAAAPDTTSNEWRRAVAFYQSRAYDQLYRWSWTQSPLEYAAFIDFIRQSNDANRRAMMDLGVVIANHVLSMVDAYITVRLRQDVSRGQFALEAQLPLPRLSIK
jgi:hypothetical protein